MPDTDRQGLGVVVVTHDPVVVDAADRAVAIAGDTPSASHTPPASTAVAHRRRKPIFAKVGAVSEQGQHGQGPRG